MSVGHAAAAVAQGHRLVGATAALVALVVLVTAANAFARPEPAKRAQQTIDGRFIVVYKSSVEDPARQTEKLERTKGFKSRLRYGRALKGFAAKLSTAQVRALRADPTVGLVAPDRPVKAVGSVPLVAGEPTPPPGLRRIGAATASTTREASGANVAVIDTGVDLDHPDLNVTSGKNCVSPSAAADDDHGHGTHVAGTIAAENDGSGVVGGAPASKVFAAKVLDRAGSGTMSQVICGIDWVAATRSDSDPSNDISVANMSLGGSGQPVQSCATTSDPEHKAICNATAAGVHFVVAAGNDGWDFDYPSAPDVPAAYPEALTVTAMGDTDGQAGAAGAAPSCRTGEADDRYASFSNYAATTGGERHTIAAPGVCIRSTARGGGYTTMSGTSMAAPHVAGALALCLEEGGARGPCAGLSPAQVVERFRAEAASRSAGEPGSGFAGDPTQPLTGRYFGHLAWVGNAGSDTVAPETSISSGPTGTISQTTASFSFTSTESGSTFKCKLDAGTWETCTSPKAFSSLSEGEHTFNVQAVDAAGNADTTPATRTFTVSSGDTVAPETTLDAGGPSNVTADATPTFSFSSESGATFECRVDSEPEWSSCGSPHTTGALADGSHTFAVRARDAAGNADPTPAARAFTVDSTSPDTAIPSGPSGTITQTSASFDFTSTESGSSFRCKLDAGLWETCISPKALTGLADGSHTFSVQAIDPAGNADATPATRTFTVDATAPTARPPVQSFVQPSGLGTSTVPVKLSWPAGSDNATGSTALRYDVEEKTNTGAFTPIASNTTALSISRSLAQSSTYQYRVRSRDGAGNVSAWATAAAFSPIPYQENSAAVAYGGTWTRVALSGAFGGYVKYTSAGSATSTLTFTGRNVAVVMPKRSGLGSAKICIDSASCSTVGLGSTTSPRQVVYKRDGLNTATHKVTVTRVSGRIDLDGFVVLR